MKFKELFANSASYHKTDTKEQLALKICEEAGELAKAVNEEGKGEVLQEVGDLILATFALYSRYETDVEKLKPLIARKLNR